MPTPLIWSERVSGASWTDCTYSSVLMVLVNAGQVDYPEGIYTGAERDALERHDNRPDNTGATFADTDLAVRNRYGVSMHKPSGSGRISSSTLRSWLGTVGRGYALAGANSHLPPDVPDHSPGFVGAHAVCVIPQGGGRVLWLDPLDVNKAQPRSTSVDAVVTWAQALNGDSHDPRWLLTDELEAMDVDILGTFDRTIYGWQGIADAPDGLAAMHTEPTAESPTLAEYPNGTGLEGTMLVSSQGAQWYVLMLWVQERGNYCVGYIHQKDVSERAAPEPEPEPPPDACTELAAEGMERAQTFAFITTLVALLLVAGFVILLLMRNGSLA